MFQDLLNSYVEYRQAEILKLKQMSVPEFRVLELDCASINDQFSSWAQTLSSNGILLDTPVLYYFRITGNGDGRKIQELIKKRKKKAGSRNFIAFPRVNSSITEPGDILYVGKTNSNFIARFKGHLGLSSASTYSLQLLHWACAMNLKLSLHYAAFDKDVLDIKYLEELESVLHYHFKPILGRSGH